MKDIVEQLREEAKFNEPWLNEAADEIERVRRRRLGRLVRC